jgi:hypothetical protein
MDENSFESTVRGVGQREVAGQDASVGEEPGGVRGYGGRCGCRKEEGWGEPRKRMGVVAEDDGDDDSAEREGDASGASWGAGQRACRESTRSNKDSAGKKSRSHVTRRERAGEAVPWNGMHASALYAAATENMLDTSDGRKGATSCRGR